MLNNHQPLNEQSILIGSYVGKLIERDLSRGFDTYSFKFQNNNLVINLTCFAEGQFKIASPESKFQPMVYNSQKYGRDGIFCIFNKLSETKIDSLSTAGCSSELNKRSLLEIAGLDLDLFVQAESTLFLIKQLNFIKNSIEKDRTQLRSGLERSARFLAEYYEIDYGKQMREYIFSNNLAEAGVFSSEDSFVHYINHIDLAKIFVRAFAEPKYSIDNPKAWEIAISSLDRIGYRKLSEKISTGLIVKVQTDMQLEKDRLCSCRSEPHLSKKNRPIVIRDDDFID